MHISCYKWYNSCMNNTSKAISGTELVESILGGPNVDRLLDTFGNKEHAVL